MIVVEEHYVDFNAKPLQLFCLKMEMVPGEENIVRPTEHHFVTPIPETGLK